MKFALLVIAMTQPIQVPADICQELANQSNNANKVRVVHPAYCIMAETNEPIIQSQVIIKQYDIERAGSDEPDDVNVAQPQSEASR